jgi:hypothetical protein
VYTLKNIFKNYPLETYILIILPISWVLFSSAYNQSILSIHVEGKWEFIIWGFYSGHLIYLGLMILYFYFYFRLIIGIANWVSKKVLGDTTPKIFKIRTFILSFIYLLLWLGLSNLVLALFLQQLAKESSPESIINASELYMSMDKEIFGGIPQLWIQHFSQNYLFDYLLIESYCKLFLFVTIVFLGLLFFNKEQFRKFVLAFFVASFLGVPFWYWLPAVSPDDMYRRNIYSLKSVTPIQKQFEEAIKSEKLKTFLGALEQIDTKATKKKFNMVSTNPSMHVAWGGIITYYSLILWWPLGFVFIPWFLLNMISTVYTMQHYVVDLPCGLICAAIAIAISHFIFKFEKKYYVGNYAPFYFITMLQSDFSYVKNKVAAKLLVKK